MQIEIACGTPVKDPGNPRVPVLSSAVTKPSKGQLLYALKYFSLNYSNGSMDSWYGVVLLVFYSTGISVSLIWYRIAIHILLMKQKLKLPHVSKGHELVAFIFCKYVTYLLIEDKYYQSMLLPVTSSLDHTAF